MLRSLWHVFCIMQYALCIIYSVLWILCRVICVVYNALCIMQYGLLCMYGVSGVMCDVLFMMYKVVYVCMYVQCIVVNV